MTARSGAAAAGLTPDADRLVPLVEAAQAGDRASFAALYARFARTVHGIVLARVPRADVDDLVQDVFLVAMQRLPALEDPAAFPGWLGAIARHRTVDFFRRRRPTSELPDLPAPPAGDQVEALAILAAIRSLPATYAETLTLRLVEGFTGPEIAASTGLTEGSVRVNLHRGMKQLRERLEGGLP
jgi:RNA polymerase sigma-70 factor (ECF subfamily)